MIDVYSWPTPNGQKIHIALEELGVEHQYKPVNIGAGEQFTPEFRAINPNHRIPAIVDHDGPGGGAITVFESGAILIYLSEKTGRLIPSAPADRYACLQWLMFQMAGVGPMFGQWNHFANYAPDKIPYAIERYGKEAHRLLWVLDQRLSDTPYLAGAEYSIADIATLPWIHALKTREAFNLAESEHVARWYDKLMARPAVERGFAKLTDLRQNGPMTDEQRRNLFGDAQHPKK